MSNRLLANPVSGGGEYVPSLSASVGAKGGLRGLGRGLWTPSRLKGLLGEVGAGCKLELGDAIRAGGELGLDGGTGEGHKLDEVGLWRQSGGLGAR